MTKIVEKIIWVGDGKRENKLWYEDLLITYNDGTYEKIRINLNKYVYMTTLNQRFKTFFDIKQLKNKTMTNVKKELNNLSKKWRTLQKEEDEVRHKEDEFIKKEKYYEHLFMVKREEEFNKILQAEG